MLLVLAASLATVAENIIIPTEIPVADSILNDFNYEALSFISHFRVVKAAIQSSL
jgi:hypothetical protein